MFTRVRKSEARIRQIADNKIARNFITKEISPNVSLAVLDAKNYEEDENTEYDKIYYVLEGSLTLVFQEETMVLEEDDCIFVNKGTNYKMRGSFKVIIVNQPAFGTKNS